MNITSGRKAAFYIIDVSDEEEVIKMVQDVVADFGELNVGKLLSLRIIRLRTRYADHRFRSWSRMQVL